jgi:hypothetical protein
MAGFSICLVPQLFLRLGLLLVVGLVAVYHAQPNPSFKRDALRRPLIQTLCLLEDLMARFFLIIIMLVATHSVFAGTEFKSQEEFSHWLTFYYENPEPNRIPDAVKYMSQAGVLDNSNAISGIFGFLSGVFRDNPGQINPWLKELRKLKEEQLGVVVLGIWYSGLPDSKSRVSVLLDQHPKLRPEFSFIDQGLPMTVEQIPFEQGSWVLDALWGKFMATGERTLVERIITTLPWLDIKGDTNRLLIGGSARWSLTSNAIQHKRVLEICEEAVKTQSGEVAAKLGEVIENAKKDLQTQHNPAVNTDAAR